MECVYREKGQPGLRAGYGKSVEHRLNQLEETVQQMTLTLHDLTINTTQSPPLDTTLWESARPALLTDNVNESPSWPSGEPLPETQLAITGLEGEIPLAADQGRTPQAQIDLPPNDVLVDLAELFFELIYPCTRLFHKQRFLNNMFSSDRRLLLHAITVVSFRYWIKADPGPSQRDRYVQASRDKILLTATDECSVISTQALILLAVDAMGHAPGPRTWSVMAHLTAAAHQLGLAKDTGEVNQETNITLVRNEALNESMSLSLIDQEERRRLFWTIYVLERFSSLSHGSPCSVDVKNIKQRFPGREEDWDRPARTD